MEQIKVIYSNTGIANYFGDYIEINKRLKQDKFLRDYIIKHELGHSDKFDIKHDIGINPFVFVRLMKFIIKNPSTWIDFLPIQFKHKKIVFDLNVTILYGVIAFLIGVIVLLFKFNIF